MSDNLEQVTCSIWAAETIEEAWEAMQRAIKGGWVCDPHATTPDVTTVEAAADDLKHKLGEDK